MNQPIQTQWVGGLPRLLRPVPPPKERNTKTMILWQLKSTPDATLSALMKAIGKCKSVTLDNVNALINSGVVVRVANGRYTTYRITK